MSLTEQQHKFVEAFITAIDDGDLPESAGPRARLIKASSAWQSASDSVDAQISKLQSALRGTDDEELHEIAEYGMNGLTGNHKVRLIAVLRDILSAQPEAMEIMAKTAQKLTSDFRAHLQGSKTVEACESNPFGVSVSICPTLLPALDQIDAALAQV